MQVSAGAAATQVAHEGVRDYRIPAGPLDETLNRFGRESGLLLSFTQDQVQGLRSPGVQERATSVQALNRLLAGTG
ncbi:MAG: STN domain-containing protein, partial [Comamonas sp.]